MWCEEVIIEAQKSRAVFSYSDKPSDSAAAAATAAAATAAAATAAAAAAAVGASTCISTVATLLVHIFTEQIRWPAEQRHAHVAAFVRIIFTRILLFILWHKNRWWKHPDDRTWHWHVVDPDRINIIP